MPIPTNAVSVSRFGSGGPRRPIRGSRGPGQPGSKQRGAGGPPNRRRQRRQSEYGKQLTEKQQAKRLYGLRERQFRLYFERAAMTREATGERLLQLLETRLDNVVFRLGYGKSRKQARQLVNHGHVRVNDRRVTIPSQALRAGDTVRVMLETVERGEGAVPAWLSHSKRDLGGSLTSIPTRGEMPLDVNEQLIVEFYSR